MNERKFSMTIFIHIHNAVLADLLVII